MIKLINTMIHQVGKRSIIVILSIFLLSIGLSFYIGRASFSFCQNLISEPSKSLSTALFNKEKISRGYTLFTTFGVAKKQNEADQKVYLIDIFGKNVHSWKTVYPPFYSQMKKNGNILVSQVSPASKNFKWVTSPLIQELDWQGNVVWEYENGLLHHDFELLPNDNIAFLAYQKVPSEVAANVQGGIAKPEDNNEVYSDSILEINQQGEIQWQWHLYEHLDPKKDILGAADLHADWTHANSIRYVEKNPINGEAAYLISVRNLSFIAFVSKKSGEIIWRSPAGMFDHQHDATLMENGNILVFDNGFDIHAKTEALLGSRVSEIDPKNETIVWQFKGKDPLSQSHFFNSVLGGAQKLKNGNVLITLGTNGELLEVTPDKKIVWDYTNPYALQAEPGEFPVNYIFKARRIYPEDIDLPLKIEQPTSIISFFCKK